MYGFQLDTAGKEGRTAALNEDVSQWRSIDMEINAVTKAKKVAEDLQMSLNTYSRERFHYTFTLRNIDIEILKKFALAIACFVFFFIGAPIGALIRKG